ncbi:MAG: type I-U CRISPR-associated protein Cas7 [Sandaracinaceae bacterium]|nr:type I-U CRISPR-associated protein Cas7 [Sandaracinaceae bacterium]
MSDQTTLTQHDHLLSDDADAAAIVIRERLRPVNGPRGVFFPPTFAAIGQGKKSDYHIDRLGPLGGNGRDDLGDPEKAQREGMLANRCTVDSVPSQANRLEARLLRYSGKFIPKVTISGSRVGQVLDLLEVGHRVGDAALRYTANGGFNQFEAALRAYVSGDAGPLARLAPTSLVFGHWDSRDSATSKSTKSKARRLIRSEIVACNVARATKRSQYWSSIDPEVNEDLGQILAEAKEAASQNPETKNPASQLGMTDVPAPESPGGVIAFGPIERTTIIALSGLRALAARAKGDDEASESAATASSADPEETLALRRYLLALALASAADPGVWDLREGCILVRNGKPPAGDLTGDAAALSAVVVRHTGDEEPFTMPTKDEPGKYLEAAAAAFFGDTAPGPVELTFDPGGARTAVESQGGGGSAEPKSKKDLIKALVALPAYADKEAELKKKKPQELKELWRAAQTSADGSNTDGGSADLPST